jgi:hypothetical protein
MKTYGITNQVVHLPLARDEAKTERFSTSMQS